MGEVDGLFVAEKEDVNAAVGKQVYFGEILVSFLGAELESGDIQLITDDSELVAKLQGILPEGTGYNPLEYLEDEAG
jgi:hypothetical protein